MKLNLGSGYRPLAEYINVDIRREVGPDLVCDVTMGLPLDDSTIDEVRAVDFLEHIPMHQTIDVITEIWRVLKPGGLFYSFTPSTDGRGAFQDPTHRSFWNLNSWLYYIDDAYRRLYGIKACFTGDVRDIVSDPVRRIVHTEAVLYAVK